MSLIIKKYLDTNALWYQRCGESDTQAKEYYEKLLYLYSGNKLTLEETAFLEHNIQNEVGEETPNVLQAVTLNKQAEAAFIGAENKELMSHTYGRVNCRTWLSSQDKAELDVLFVSHNAETRGHLYRVQHICSGLNRKGVKAAWVEAKDIRCVITVLPKMKRLVIFRCDMTGQLRELINQCRQYGIEIIFDIDDFLFDDSVIDRQEIDFIRALTATQQQQWREKIDAYRASLEMCDSVCVPTSVLAQQASRFSKKVMVFPNSFDHSVKRLSQFARSNKANNKGTEDSDRVTIGYASGTPTHERDFATIKGVLLELLSKYSTVYLQIVGYLKCIEDREFDAFRTRIVVRPVVAHSLLPLELAHFDINIIPLARNRFTDSKSELKYFEAALLKLPSVAVANPVYNAIIKQGDNGYLAANEESWFKALSLLIESPQLRTEIGNRAYEHVLCRYDVDVLTGEYLNEVLHF